jgi:hypothetical protein
VEFVVALLAELLAEEAWTAVKQRLRPPPPDWAETAAGALTTLPSLQLSGPEAAAVARWLRRTDVFAALIDADASDPGRTVAAIVEPLKFELGPPSDDVARRADLIACAAIVHLVEITASDVAVAIAGHRRLRADTSSLLTGQAVLYEVLLDVHEAVESVRSGSRPVTPGIVAGWQEVTSAFLDERRRSLSAEELVRYFDGQVPSWRHALADTIPRRDLASQLTTTLLAWADNRAPRAQFVVGASGEGKSTLLLQVAAAIAHASNAAVYWHLGRETTINVEEILALRELGRPVLLVFDEADSLVPRLEPALRAAFDPESWPLLLLGGARMLDWRRRGGPARVQSWQQFLECDTAQLGPVTLEEASRIVDAWDAGGEAGLAALAPMAPSDRARRLHQAACRTTGELDGTLFGAVLDVRFTREALLGHVSQMMERMAVMRLNDRARLLDGFAYVAAADAIGDVDGLDRVVLAHLTDVELASIQSKVVTPFGNEAAGSATSSAIRARHKSIARAAVVLLDRGTFDLDAADTYAALVGTTAAVGLTGRRVHAYSELVHAGPRLLTAFDGLLPPRGPRGWSLAAARSAVDNDPRNLGLAVELAYVLRHLGQVENAVVSLRGAVADGVAEFRDFSRTVRGFLLELAVVVGLSGALVDASWLALASLCDRIAGREVPLDPDRAGRALRSAVVGLSRLGSASGNALDAVAILARQTPAPTDPRELAGASVSGLSVDEALDAMRDEFGALRGQVQDRSLLALVEGGTFNALREIVLVGGSSHQEGSSEH